VRDCGRRCVSARRARPRSLSTPTTLESGKSSNRTCKR
jgi:hypothetical protein